MNDEVLSGNVLGKNIIFSQQNYIGEMSTVLLRKSLLKQNNGEFLTGYFCGFWDMANGDVASFLDIARQGKQCVFLHDTLSCFRRHSGQKTFNNLIIVDSITDWLNYITISWHEKHFIENTQELEKCYRMWFYTFGCFIINTYRQNSGEKNENLLLCMRIVDLIKNNDYDKVFDVSWEYIKPRVI